VVFDTHALRALGWHDPPTQTDLVPGEIQLWLVKVPDADANMDALLARLTSAERERAAAKRVSTKQREYITGQATLRTLLAMQLDVDPDTVEYRRGIKGKPYLADRHARQTSYEQLPLQFNITHSGEIVMLAMSLGAELGVDVEWHNERTDPHRVARRAFSEPERATFEQITPQQQREHFFALWTCKEALVKCTGLGIHSGMSNYEITLDGIGNARVASAWDSQAGVERLHVLPLPLGVQHAGALVHEPPVLQVRRWILDADPDPLSRLNR
jgi:4'-phosphopantetheinyl transferase